SVIDTEARWEQARWLLHDGTLKPGDRVAGLLVLLYAQWPATISRLTLGHIQASSGQVRIQLGPEPAVLPEPLDALILQLAATRRRNQPPQRARPNLRGIQTVAIPESARAHPARRRRDRSRRSRQDPEPRKSRRRCEHQQGPAASSRYSSTASARLASASSI